MRLTSLFVLQLLLVFAFVLFGTFVSNNVNLDGQWANGNVKFIVKDSASSNKSRGHQQYAIPKFMKIVQNDNFEKHFVMLQESVSISSDISDTMAIRRICFRDGIHSNVAQRAYDNNNKTEDYRDFAACACQPEWHGDTCSEPEIVWRAFMTSREPLHPSPSITHHAHNMFYIIQLVTSINMETLEIQLLELMDIVNVFILCDPIATSDASLLMRHRMNEGFLRSQHDRVLLLRDDTCSGANIYRQMRRIFTNQMRSTDILIYGASDEILNRRALMYFKWHNNWHQPVRFRLKWNVYGFFFQHPDNTTIRSIVCQLNVLEQFYKSDPDRILVNPHSPTILVIGDLNHYGGWYCEYCHQPIDIIRKLQLDSKLLNNTANVHRHRHPVINIEYVQNLIHDGKYIDGRTELRKLRHYDTNYYQPEAVAKNRWKFDNIAINLFASWDDDLDSNLGDY